VGMAAPKLIFCADGNPAYAAAAVEAGWLYGARLPATVYQSVHFADQDWKAPDRAAYMRALAIHKPSMATVLDWERPEQLPEVLDWAEEAAQHVGESVLIIPKVSGGVPRLPRVVGGKRVVLAYSVPTKYGGACLGLWEFGGWPVHLLGGSPHAQMRDWAVLACCAEVVSVDGNMIAKQSRRGLAWQAARGKTSHWWLLRDLGDSRGEGVPLECFRRSLAAVSRRWRDRVTPPTSSAPR
jgi:hypothetical protein